MRLEGWLDPIGGEIVCDELDRLELQPYLADQAAGITRSIGQRRAAALVEMAARSRPLPDGATTPRPLFTVVVGDESFAQRCELASGTVISPGHLLPHLCRCDLETVQFADPKLVAATTPRRSFEGKLRRANKARHWQHPRGCDTAASRGDVDHIVARYHGGQTSQFNGRLEGRPHNRHADRHDHGATPVHGEGLQPPRHHRHRPALGHQHHQ